MASSAIFNAADFGTWSDPTLNTAGLKAALAEAHNNGGGLVVLTGPNTITLNATVQLYSNVILWLIGTTVQPAAGFSGPLFSGTSLNNVQILGNGVLDGNSLIATLASFTSCDDLRIDVVMKGYTGTPLSLTSCLRVAVGSGPGFDVTRFGALGDGSANDGPALQAAFTCAGESAVDGAIEAVQVPAGTYLTNQELNVPSKVTVRGRGRGSMIKAGGSFPSSTPLVRLGTGAGIVENCRLEDLYLNCNSVTGSVGVYTTEAQEQSGCKGVVIANYMSHGIHINAASSEHATWEDLEIGASASATSSVGILCIGAAHRFCRITVNPEGGAAQQDKAIYLQNIGFLSNIHVENHTYGVYVDDTGSPSYYGAGGLDGFDGAATVGTCVYLGGSHSFSARDIVQGGATTTLNDNTNSVAITASYVPYYSNYLGQGFGAGLAMRGAFYPVRVDGTENLSVALYGGPGAPSGTPAGSPGKAYYYRSDGGAGTYVYYWNGTTWTGIL